MEYNYRYGQKITKEIKGGRVIHEELENEVNVPIMLQPKSYSDALYKKVYTSVEALRALKKNKKTREVQLYGSIGGYKVVGKIDQLEIRNNKVVISEDKTRANGNVPSKSQQLVHKIQVLVYKKLLDDLVNGLYNYNNFEVAYHIKTLNLTDEFKRQLDVMDIRSDAQNIQSIARNFFSMLQSFDGIDNTMYIRYINQFTGDEIKQHKLEYKGEEINGIIKYILRYWSGERESAPVPEQESWKCNYCVFFGEKCKVWWKQRGL